uniref:uncharacterized protein LOC104266399 n=1 Tax=Ciona intestinalis TaxID=7719 RepID=UPI00089DBC1F|nr:uncharacterized protein LOC104266399 [Ciona intestinalis]|eukprot:XP_026693475.1 uncharacterized protein LOC104266399 [Ciona intestinalis]
MASYTQVGSGQMLGTTLLVIAWTGILVSFIIPDWRRSVVKLPETTFEYEPMHQFNESSQEPDCILCILKDIHLYHINSTVTPTEADENSSQDTHSVTDTNLKTIFTRPSQWFTIGIRGLWTECAFLPNYPDPKFLTYTSKTNLSASVEIRPVAKNDSIAIKGNLTVWTKYHTQLTSQLHYANNLVAIVNLEKSKNCTYVSLQRSTCLLMGIRAVALLGIFIGTVACVLAVTSVIFDGHIRESTFTHPNISRFRRHNVLSVLAGALAGLSGMFGLISCWWFTLDVNTRFFMPSYQLYHIKNGGTFIAGSSLLMSGSSAVLYIIGGYLMGVKSTKKKESVFVVKCNASVY